MKLYCEGDWGNDCHCGQEQRRQDQLLRVSGWICKWIKLNEINDKFVNKLTHRIDITQMAWLYFNPSIITRMIPRWCLARYLWSSRTATCQWWRGPPSTRTRGRRRTSTGPRYQRNCRKYFLEILWFYHISCSCVLFNLLWPSGKKTIRDWVTFCSSPKETLAFWIWWMAGRVDRSQSFSILCLRNLTDKLSNDYYCGTLCVHISVAKLNRFNSIWRIGLFSLRSKRPEIPTEPRLLAWFRTSSISQLGLELDWWKSQRISEKKPIGVSTHSGQLDSYNHMSCIQWTSSPFCSASLGATSTT